MKYMLVYDTDNNSDILGSWKCLPTRFEIEDVLANTNEKNYILDELSKNKQVYLHDKINSIFRLIEI